MPRFAANVSMMYAEVPFMEEIAAGREDMPSPEKPTTYHNPYSLDFVMDVTPDYPEPYDTWDGKSVA